MAGAHQLGALMSGLEEAAVDEGEAESLARALLDVWKQRKLKPNPELLAWGNFVAVALAVYLPRVIALLAKRRQAREAERAVPHLILKENAAGEVVIPPAVN